MQRAPPPLSSQTPPPQPPWDGAARRPTSPPPSTPCPHRVRDPPAQQPFRVNFLDASVGPSFHQCVYILCAKERDLLAANATAREAFGKPEPPTPYMPHLSVLYAGEAVHAQPGSGGGTRPELGRRARIRERPHGPPLSFHAPAAAAAVARVVVGR
jgi:hypothetical protein